MIDAAIWSGRKVFLTGHTGFKGGWLSAWLSLLGARTTGFSLAPETSPSLFEQAGIAGLVAKSVVGDIRDRQILASAMAEATPDLVIHMAAQPLVRRSYREPVATWDTNVMGTVNVFEAVRQTPSVKAVVIVTTDKCYENNEWVWGYREIDKLGGHDPYSASKAASELVASSYRKSFMATAGVLVGSGRAGNVIGGGDWSEDRLVPDAVRATSRNHPLVIRSPKATRPWQHVLDCLSGYLTLSQRLLVGDACAATAFNFGPEQTANLSVESLLAGLKSHWEAIEWTLDPDAANAPHEAAFLYLDSAKAKAELDWRPRWDVDQALRATADWYRAHQADPSSARDVTMRQIEAFMA
jgi:CDP-glucose 4,6-dehydratase